MSAAYPPLWPFVFAALVLLAFIIGLHYWRAALESRRPGRPTLWGILFIAFQVLATICLVVLLLGYSFLWFVGEANRWLGSMPTPRPLPTFPSYPTPPGWPTLPPWPTPPLPPR